MKINYFSKYSRDFSNSILFIEYLLPILFTTIDETIDAINKETEGSILCLRRTLKIASIESPAPTLSIGFELNAGQ